MSKIEGLDELNQRLDEDVLAILKEKLPGLDETYVKYLTNLVLNLAYRHERDVILLMKKRNSVIS